MNKYGYLEVCEALIRDHINKSNTIYFGGMLPRHEIYLSFPTNPKAIGQYVGRDSLAILISPAINTTTLLVNTILHEMIHFWDMSHGKTYRTVATAVGFKYPHAHDNAVSRKLSDQIVNLLGVWSDYHKYIMRPK